MTIRFAKCSVCEEEIDFSTFRDDASIAEHKISGMCQACQDDFYGDNEEEEDGED